MKRCPTCQQTYTDETLQFCRVDGALLIDDTSLSDESSATRILPASQTGEAVGLIETAQSPGTTSALDAGAKSKAQTGDHKERRSASKVDYVVNGIKQHKIATLISLIVIAAGIAGISAYLRVVTRGGVSNIWAQPIDGSAPKQLTHFKTDRIFSFDWSGDGKQLAC